MRLAFWNVPVTGLLLLVGCARGTDEATTQRLEQLQQRMQAQEQRLLTLEERLRGVEARTTQGQAVQKAPLEQEDGVPEVEGAPSRVHARFEAAVCGAMFTFEDFETRQPVEGHEGRPGCHYLPADPRTGVVTAALSGGSGEYRWRFYVAGRPLPYDVATSGPGASGLTLTAAAQQEGWRMEAARQPAQLLPPAQLLQPAAAAP